MKLTKRQLTKLIKEELENVLEGPGLEEAYGDIIPGREAHHLLKITRNLLKKAYRELESGNTQLGLKTLSDAEAGIMRFINQASVKRSSASAKDINWFTTTHDDASAEAGGGP